MSAAIPQPAPSLPERLGLILGGLRRDLAFRAARDRALAALVLLLWSRLSRALARFSAVLVRHQAGTLRTAAKPRRRTAPAATPPRDPLPRERGWLVRRIPECSAHGEYLRLLLADPEMVGLLEASPQARRLLRPLWRMLRTETVPETLRAPASLPTTPSRVPVRATVRHSRPGARRAPIAPTPAAPHGRSRAAPSPVGRKLNRA